MTILCSLLLLLLPAIPCQGAEKGFTVAGDSMSPALRPGERVVVRETGPEDLRIGDLVAIRLQGRGAPMVKRVAAIPGDLVSLEEGMLRVNGRRHQPPAHIDPVKWEWTLRQLERGGWVIPPGNLMVLGDNQGDSLDSRKLGLIPWDRVLGRVEKVKEDGEPDP